MPVNLVHERTGERISVDDDPTAIAIAANKGFRPERTSDVIAAAKEAEIEKRTGGVGGAVGATMASFARGATLGGSDAIIAGVGGADAAAHTRDLQERQRIASIGGEILGTVASLGTSLPGGLAAKAGARIAQTAEGASALTRVGRAFAGGATEGFIQGAGSGVSELALSDKPLDAERIASVMSSNMLFGGAAGGAAGAAAKGFEIGLGRAKRAIDDFKARGDVADALPDDLANMDVKQLRAARDVEIENIKAARVAEKQGIETARVAERQSIADGLGQHHQALDLEKPWLATKDSTEGEIRTIGKQLFNANKQLRNMLDNPKYLAEKPQQALAGLQKQEHALEQMLRVDGRLRRTFGAADDVAGQALSHAEEGALFRYQGGGYLDVQDYARTGKRAKGSSFRTAKDAKAEIANLDNAIAKSEVEADQVVYRGFADEVERRAGITGELKVGGIIRDKGFSSVSTQLDQAAEFSSKAGGKPTLLEIELPKGARAAKIAPDGGMNEAELLLGRNSGFQVTDIRDATIGGRNVRVARVKYLGPEGTQKAGSGARAAALDTVPAALERNRALQARIREASSDIKLATPEVSPRLQQIDEARDLLAAGKGDKSIAEQALSGAVFSGVAGAVSTVPVIGPMLAPLIGARAAKLVEGGVLGRMGKVTGELAKRGSRAVDTLLSASKEVSRLAPPLASKTLAAVRYAPEEPGAKAPKKRVDLATLYADRSKELRSQTMYAADGSIQMRPETRAQVAAKLDPIRAVDPIAADQLETIVARRVEFLASKLPRRPDIGGLPLSASDRWRPSDMEMRQFARYVAAVEDPMGIAERVADGTVTPSDTEVMKAVYPEMYADISQQIVSRLPELRASLPYRQRLALSRFTGQPVDASMHPRILAVLQAQHAAEPGTQGGTAPPKPQPNFSAFGSTKSARGEAEQTASQKRSAA